MAVLSGSLFGWYLIATAWFSLTVPSDSLHLAALQFYVRTHAGPAAESLERINTRRNTGSN